MSEPDENAPELAASAPAPPPRRSRLRRFFLRHLPVALASTVVLLAVVLTSLYFVASSPGFESYLLRQTVKWIETAIGGRAEIASFHWDILHLEAEADGLVIHGLEDRGEAPYAQVDRLRVRISLLGLLSPHIRLRFIEIVRPHLHLIVYADGSTNQPQPRTPQKSGKPTLDKFFDLKANAIAVEQGTLFYENRAATFDYQDRYIPLDFSANDLSLRMSSMSSSALIPANDKSTHPLAHTLGGRRVEFYRIEAAVHDLRLARGPCAAPCKASPPAVEGFFQASLDLSRSSAILRSLRITAGGHGIKPHTLEISGSVDDFSHPRWQAKLLGDLDLRLVDPITGYPYAPDGLAHLDLAGAGAAGAFHADGSLHVDHGSYIGTGVVAKDFTLDARIHGDRDRLLVTSILVRLPQGGQMEGELDLHPWLPFLPGTTTVQPTRLAGVRATGPGSRDIAVPVLPFVIPVNGKVSAQFKNVALDTLLDMLADPPYQHLGFDARVSGPANAHWSNGDENTLSVDADFALVPPLIAASGKVPASGRIDATYTQRDGAVDLRKLELDLPSSQLLAHGHLGAYPLTSPSALAVEFHSANLGEFDTVLRKLGLARNAKTGVAALPFVLGGNFDLIHGFWAGSLDDPRISGDLKATEIALDSAAFTTLQPGQNSLIHLDSIEATGSYSAARIDVSRGQLHSGKASVDVSGSLAATPPIHRRGAAPPAAFDANSQLHLRLRAAQAPLDDLWPFLGRKLPLDGALDAQLQFDGPLRAPEGSGWAQIDHGLLFAEPVDRIRALGTLAGQTITLSSLTLSGVGGTISATGSCRIPTRGFQLNANAAGIDVARIEALRRSGLALSGKFGFTAQGEGSLDDPRLTARADLTGLALNGNPLGDLEVDARTADRTLSYLLTSRLNAAALSAHGQTALTGDFATHAQVDFSHLDIGELFKLAHLQGLKAGSALSGSISLDGPLAHPDDLRGEARLDPLTFTLEGINLRSDAGLHATLDHANLHLDPLHLTGAETDLHAQGSLSLRQPHQLDFSSSGSVNLKLAESFDRDLSSSGSATFQMIARGPLMNPDLSGHIDLQDAALSIEQLPNGLSRMNGRMEFNQNRLEVRSLTAMSGGGVLSLSGYLAYQHGLYADLTASGKGIRVRYPQGVSSMADAQLRLQGQSSNLLLSGDVLITRFSVSPDLDMTALTAQTSSVQAIASPDAPSNRVRLDVHISSSPQLNFQNAYAKLAGNIDLHLRGTLATPSLLGRISITEGSAILAGTRYDLQRGDIFFTNPVRIEPSIDLNATARVEDYDITLGLHGTPEKMAVTYRSDPPLPEADVVALLALGRTGNQQRLYTDQQQQALSNPTTDALLGGALNAAVSSRVQRLFGAGSVKVDPNYLGVLGNSTSRIIVEEQLGRTLTLTYATNVDSTSQQLLQADIALSRNVTLQLARDESGVFSVVLKATRRFK